MDGSTVTDVSSLKKRIRPVSEMSSPEAEGGQDYGDILGFPGDGFKDKNDANPAEVLLTVIKSRGHHCGDIELTRYLTNGGSGAFGTGSPYHPMNGSSSDGLTLVLIIFFHIRLGI
jgi:hypothetical protein